MGQDGSIYSEQKQSYFSVFSLKVYRIINIFTVLFPLQIFMGFESGRACQLKRSRISNFFIEKRLRFMLYPLKGFTKKYTQVRMLDTGFLINPDVLF